MERCYALYARRNITESLIHPVLSVIKRVFFLSIASKKEVLEKVVNHLKTNSQYYGFEELRPIFENYRLGNISDIEFLNQGIGFSKYFPDMIIEIYREIK